MLNLLESAHVKLVYSESIAANNLLLTDRIRSACERHPSNVALDQVGTARYIGCNNDYSGYCNSLT